MRNLVAFLLLLLSSACLYAQGAEPDWKKLDFLIGKWVAVASETPSGAGQGEATFDFQLNKRIMVRRSYAQYSSGPRHDDLLIIYIEDTPRAIYFDSEGHVIRYKIAFPAAESVVFESDGTQPGPRYRLSYWMDKPSLKGKFEIAPPGAGSEYKTYLTWTSRKP